MKLKIKLVISVSLDTAEVSLWILFKIVIQDIVTKPLRPGVI